MRFFDIVEFGRRGLWIRSYDAQIGRFIQADPYDQFASPYTGMGNDPMNLVDPSGGIAIPCPGSISALSGIMSQVSTLTMILGVTSNALQIASTITTQQTVISAGKNAGVDFKPKNLRGQADTLPSGRYIYDEGGWEEYENLSNPYYDGYDPNQKIRLSLSERLYLLGHLAGFAFPTVKLPKFKLPWGKAKEGLKAIEAGEYTITKTVAKNLATRPYINSPSTITNIMKSSKGVPDAFFKGGMNYKMPGTFNGANGIFELGINPETNTIYHFLFKTVK